MKVAIYALLDRNFDTRYIGKSKDPEARFREHRRRGQRWAVNYEVIEWVDSLLWQQREIYWIWWYGTQGYHLANRTIGGDGLVNPSADVRARISASLKARGWTMSPEHRRKISEANRGKKVSHSTRSLLSAQKTGDKNPFFGTAPWNCGKGISGMSGRRHSAESRRRMSETAKARGTHKNFLKADS